ncbi:YlbF family regulator [Cytobacillus kochii]|uniref:YlbF family regulator n=1 Tax=Cytobacillus kochii TaxID=859143 RepID=UPI00399D3B80
MEVYEKEVFNLANNLQDAAIELEKAIRESNEYQSLKDSYDKVNADPSAKSMFDNFRNIQIQLQQKQMSGQEITQEEVDQAQKTVALVQQHELISKLMADEQKMSEVITDLNKTIMKPLEDLYGAAE